MEQQAVLHHVHEPAQDRVAPAEADDDSLEEPLLYEDGELAPALGADEDVISADEQADEVEEALVGDKFDAVFGAEEETAELESDMEIADDIAEPQEIAAEEEFLFDSSETDETLLEEDMEVDAEIEQEATAEDIPELMTFEDAGFEEIVDEEIEEIPEDAFVEIEEDTALIDVEEEIMFSD